MSDDDEDDTPKGLNWYEERGRYFIAWEWDDGPGLCLGEGKGRDDDHAAATAAARAIGSPEQSGNDSPLYWDSKGAVRKALTAARTAVETYNSGIPLPDWALKAQSEGWNPPKGWKPKKGGDIAKSQYLRGGAEGWEAAAVSLASMPVADAALGEMLVETWRGNAAELRRQADDIEK